MLERGPYTTLLRLTQEPAPPWSSKPSLTIRLYHDARCAEVVEYQGKRHFRAVYDYPNEDMRHPDEKAQINRFLSEYLAVCLAHGYRPAGRNAARQLTATLTLLQLTDLHLLAEPDSRLLGGSTAEGSLRAVLDQAFAERQPDAVLATGDITHHGDSVAYQRFDKAVCRLLLRTGHGVAG